ncbi:hypothetical protein SDC9_201280 [bioreactor metagenome]|uniref:VOC domain-containing protein n=1 Tax=bioreactor metagenome TaxID=1076179 RepID=A0A645IR88_9ZZZZ|nr:VOC family protein [Candidatus Metalachnospira sp.]
MKIAHIAIYVNDLEATKEFFETYFNAVSNDIYHNPDTRFSSYFLTFEDGARLEIMSRKIMTDSPKALLRTGYIHMAFSVGGKEAVDRLTDKLKTAGYRILTGPRITGDGYYESSILDSEDNQIEITE